MIIHPRNHFYRANNKEKDNQCFLMTDKKNKFLKINNKHPPCKFQIRTLIIQCLIFQSMIIFLRIIIIKGK